MLYVTGLRIRNWGRFRGEHELTLGPGMYAVVAHDSADPRRSNWLGKTLLLSSIRWVLTGVPDCWKTLDDAFPRGADEMSVEVELSDGTFVSKSLKRGKSVQTWAVLPVAGGGEREYAQDAAAQAIADRLCLSDDDLIHTMWIGQGEAERLVVAKPAELTSVVSQWLGLGALDEGCERLARQNADLTKQEVACRTSLEAAAKRESESELLPLLEQAQQRALVASRLAADARAAEAKQQNWKELQRRHDASQRQVDEARSSLERLPVPSREDALKLLQAKSDYDAAAKVKASVEREVFRLERLSRGEFDGECPVMRAPCPAKDAVCAAADAIAVALSGAREQLRVEELSLNGARDRVARAQRAADAVKRFDEDRIRLETMANARVEPSPVGEYPAAVEIPLGLDLLQCTRDVKGLEDRLTRTRAQAAEYEQTAGRLKEIVQRVAAVRAAMRIFGRGGAQRKIALDALQWIERRTNRRLAASNIDLSVQLQYGREQQGLAVLCDCGAPFDRSTRVRTCWRCGATRGPKRDDKLYVFPSHVSGAAKDLTGLTLQISAAEWLRSSRGSDWGVLVLDEPFGKLDEANRRSLAGALWSIVEGGFQQAFVVAHSQDVLEAMPKRIEIRGDGDWSTVRVVE